MKNLAEHLDLPEESLPEYEAGVTWRSVQGFPNYLISDRGDVWSIKRRRLFKRSISNQYYTVTLTRTSRIFSDPGDVRAVGVHRLVAETYVPGRTEVRNVVNHIDSDKLNNHWTNLEWVTPEENTHHSLRHRGLWPKETDV